MVSGVTYYSDGNDQIFGDLGNDWAVGGTGRDHLYGGWGDDLLNADDDLGTNGGLNDIPDTHTSYEDLAYGGAGRDRLIGNTGGDRLIDWAGEFNSYIVPFAPFGNFTVSRSIQPQLPEFLYALSEGDGADLTMTSSLDPVRNGEPFAELGLVKQQDEAWRDQTGAPDDPQPGNIPGGSRDVLRAANFNDGTFNAFAPDSGSWKVEQGALKVSAQSLGGDAVAVFFVGDALPAYFEIAASISVDKPTSGWKGNSYIIFDYYGEKDFKFAGLDVSLNKLVMGHRDATGWIVDKQAPFLSSLKANTAYNMLLAINGVNATLLIDNKTVFSFTYKPRVIDGFSFGLNYGMVGVGSDNSRGVFDNVKVQVLPPQYTMQSIETFDDGVANQFDPSTGWTISGTTNKTYDVTPSGNAVSLMNLGVENLEVSSVLDLSAVINTQGRAGFIYDRYDANTFKFVVLDVVADKVIMGHYTARSGWVTDASYAKVLDAEVNYTLGISLKGSTTNVTLNGQTIVGFAYNAATVDGRFGLMAVTGATKFDDVKVKTTDPSVTGAVTTMVAADSPDLADITAPITASDLAPIVDEAIRRLSSSLDAAQLAALRSLTLQVSDLPWLTLGDYGEGRVWIDADAGGHGWFVDQTPGDDSEFASQQGTLLAVSGPAAGRMDLLTVVMHELGHAAGLDHAETGFMAEELAAGVRLAPAVSAQPGRNAAPTIASNSVFNELFANVPLPSTPAADTPVINWQGSAFGSSKKTIPASDSTWMTDFVKNLGLSEAERNPNAQIKLTVPAATLKVVSDAARRIGALFS
jgi:hypothetical protein